MDMNVNSTRGDDFPFPGDHLGSRPNNDANAGLHVGVAGFANRCNAPIPDRDVGLHYPPVIKNKSIGDHRINGTFATRTLRLTHSVSDDFPTPELHFFAVNREVFFHLNHQIGIGKAHFVPSCRPKHLRVFGASHYVRHSQSLSRSWEVVVAMAGRGQRAHDSLIKAIDQARASIGDQPNIPRLAWLEPDSSSCRDIQTKTEGGVSIKNERGVSLRKMIVAANLDWSVAGICNFEGNCCAVVIKDDLTCRRKNLAGDHLEHST